jgi:hypothetical protein
LRGFHGTQDGPCITPILQYADDTLLFVEGGTSEAEHLKALVRILGEVSGLSVSHGKSGLPLYPSTWVQR